MLMNTARNSVSLKGIRKGDATSIAIMLLSLGICAMSGPDSFVNRVFANGISATNTTPTTSTTRSRRSRSSTRWEMNGCSVSAVSVADGVWLLLSVILPGLYLHISGLFVGVVL